MKKIKVRTKQTLHLLLVLFLVVNSILCFSNGVSADTGNGSGNNKSLNNFTSGVLIDGRVPDNPMTNVIRGKEYEVSLKFTERENLQFDITSMTYTMPSQFQANSGTKKLNVSYHWR